MKGTLAFIMLCLVLFIGVTFLFIDANKKYHNIFKLDFKRIDTLSVKDTLKVDSLQLAKEKIKTDSLKADSLFKVKEDSVKAIDVKAKAVDKEKAEVARREMIKAKERADSTYKAWKSSTLKLFESMDSQTVAQVIQQYSDNIAKDLIYSMKKKKAADVLRYIKPDKIAKYTKA